MGDTIQINFSKPIPVFPLASVIMLPHTLLPLRIFEPRYLQMLHDSMDSAGQIAMATFADDRWQSEYHGTPPLKPIVCIGQIVQHQKRSDELHDIVLLGICRARIVNIEEPTGRLLYRRAVLLPTEMRDEEPDLSFVRRRLRLMLDEGEVKRMQTVGKIRGLFDRDEVPTHALIELLGSELFESADEKYRLLAESDPKLRAKLIESELRALDRLIRAADRQSRDDWPKGLSWN